MCDTLEREMGQDLKNSQQGTENGKKRIEIAKSTFLSSKSQFR